MYTLLNQFLTLSVYLDRSYNFVSKTVYKSLNKVILLTIVHDITDPYTKTYSSIFIPLFYITFNNKTFDLKINTYLEYTNYNFFETLVVYNNDMNYYITSHPLKRIDKSFKKFKSLSIQSKGNSIKYLPNLYKNIDISADHICSMLRTDLGCDVQCINDELDEITFKDIDIIE